MATIDDEILLGAEEDAKEVEYIMNYLPQDVKEKFCEDVVRQTCAGKGAASDQTLEDMMFSLGEVSQYVLFLKKHFLWLNNRMYPVSDKGR